MLNENPSEPRHPVESGEPRHPLEQAPTKRQHPLSQADIEVRPQRRTQFVVGFPIARPYVTYTLIAINVLIFVLETIYPSLGDELVQFAILYRPAVVDGGEYYRLFTSMFLHGGIAHIFFNMYSLYIIGSSVEWVFGWRRYLLIYLLGGLGGSVLFVLTLAERGSGLGASGAIFAIWGAEMIFIYRHRHELGAYGRAQLRNIIIVAALNLVIGFSNPRIGTWAHIGGFVAGVALTWWLGPKLETRPHPENADVILFLGRKYDSPILPVLIYVVALVAVMGVGLRLLG